MKHTTPGGSDLQGPALGLGSTYGYSGADLTNLRTAIAREEVVWQPEGTSEPRTLELRIHGVGGAPPEVNLESPATLQVAGDARAGFYRAWFPGGTARGRPLQEAYCWGHLDTAWWTALWLLLLPFGLLNVAHWALPAVGPSMVRATARALLRLQSLLLTVALVATTCYIALDLVAWQAAERDLLWAWTGGFENWQLGTRMALMSLAVFAVIGVLWWLSHRTQGDYEDRSSGAGAPDLDIWPLSDRMLWCGALPVTRQRAVHLLAASATVLMIQGLPRSATLAWVRPVVWVVAIVVGVAAVALTLSPWTDRGVDRPDTDRPLFLDRVVVVGSRVVLGFAAVVSLARIWWQPDATYATALPYDGRVQLVLFFSGLVLAGVVALVVLAHAPWAQRDVFVRGLGSAVMTLLATLISTIFTASLLNSVAQMIARPTLATVPVPTRSPDALYLPSTAYSGGLAFLVAVISAGVTALVLVFVVRNLKARRVRQEEIGPLYAGRGPIRPDGTTRIDTEAAHTVSLTIATSRLTDSSGWALFCVVTPTFLVLLGYQALLQMHPVGNPHLKWLANAGAYLATAATIGFLAYLRSAVTDPAARKRVGFLWDVITFWPRACHPLGPPSYAERSVPEVVTRIRRIVGDDLEPYDPAQALDHAEQYDAGTAPAYREEHTDVLLVGYSQGCPIATAVVCQLPPEVRRHVRLLTMASPVRRLYGRTFPSHFGPDQIAALEVGLVGRWTNLVRETDYIGGWVKAPGGGGVDHRLLDPPVLWEDEDPAPPLTHLHSSWFSDPQTRPYAEALLYPPSGGSAAGEGATQQVELDTPDTDVAGSVDGVEPSVDQPDERLGREQQLG
ncbi:MAG: hypothetical protein WAV00_24025 [Nocardioides sp.]